MCTHLSINTYISNLHLLSGTRRNIPVTTRIPTTQIFIFNVTLWYKESAFLGEMTDSRNGAGCIQVEPGAHGMGVPYRSNKVLTYMCTHMFAHTCTHMLTHTNTHTMRKVGQKDMGTN